MLNQVVLVGRISRLVENGKSFSIKVPRAYKNVEGEYENDIISISASPTLMGHLQMVGLNDLVGVKGRLSTDNGRLKVIAEKITYLSAHTN